MAETSEKSFETVIESHLLANGYRCVPPEGFDRERAIFPAEVLAFIRRTQPRNGQSCRIARRPNREQVLGDLCKWMDTYGALTTLRHGFKCYGRTLRIAFFKAAHELNPELEERYKASRLAITGNCTSLLVRRSLSTSPSASTASPSPRRSSKIP
jgi:type I restriction enzyme R subunit